MVGTGIIWAIFPISNPVCARSLDSLMRYAATSALEHQTAPVQSVITLSTEYETLNESVSRCLF